MAWTCPACAHVNGDAAVCDACGVARRWHEDPPLDLPRAPEWHEVPATWLAWAWGALAAAGLLSYAIPPLRASVSSALGLDATWIGIEALLASAAFGSALQEAWFQRSFHRVTVEAPTSVRTGGPFEVRLTLVPYAAVEGLDLTVELIDRYYVNVERKGRTTVATRQRLVERVVLERRARLAGRREHVYRVSLDTPFPSTIHEHLGAKILASVMEPFGWLVPGLRHRAHNLREHGGFFVRATVASGPFRRRYERRVVVVHLGSTIQFG